LGSGALITPETKKLVTKSKDFNRMRADLEDSQEAIAPTNPTTFKRWSTLKHQRDTKDKMTLENFLSPSLTDSFSQAWPTYSVKKGQLSDEFRNCVIQE
jgi:hypothetical protein